MLKVESKHLSHPCYADDFLLGVDTPHGLHLLREFADKQHKSGSEDEQAEDKGDDGKRHTNIYINNTQNVKNCVYVEQTYSTRDNNQDKQIQRRLTAGWTAFAKQPLHLQG